MKRKTLQEAVLLLSVAIGLAFVFMRPQTESVTYSPDYHENPALCANLSHGPGDDDECEAASGPGTVTLKGFPLQTPWIFSAAEAQYNGSKWGTWPGLLSIAIVAINFVSGFTLTVATAWVVRKLVQNANHRH